MAKIRPAANLLLRNATSLQRHRSSMPPHLPPVFKTQVNARLRRDTAWIREPESIRQLLSSFENLSVRLSSSLSSIHRDASQPNPRQSAGLIVPSQLVGRRNIRPGRVYSEWQHPRYQVRQHRYQFIPRHPIRKGPDGDVAVRSSTSIRHQI